MNEPDRPQPITMKAMTEAFDRTVSHLRDYADAFNQLDREALIGVSVLRRTLCPRPGPRGERHADTERSSLMVAVWCGKRREHFRLSLQGGQPHLQGRGAGFSDQSTDIAMAISTVLPTRATPDHCTLGLKELLVKRRFTVRCSPSDAFDYDDSTRLITAVHRDGSRMWFTLRENDRRNLADLHFGGVHLATYEAGFGRETLLLMAKDDRDLSEDEQQTVPDAVIPRHWTLKAEALDAVIAHARSAPGTVLQDAQVPGIVPVDFYAPGNAAYGCPDLPFTRAQARAQVQREYAAYRDGQRAHPTEPTDACPQPH